MRRSVVVGSAMDELMSRIEDQLIAKFNARFAKASDHDNVLEIVINWLYFFVSEKTIRKDGSVPQVLALKRRVCDLRIGILTRKLEELGLYDKLPSHLREQCSQVQ